MSEVLTLDPVLPQARHFNNKLTEVEWQTGEFDAMLPGTMGQLALHSVMSGQTAVETLSLDDKTTGDALENGGQQGLFAGK